jgi:hypothetical protein
VTVFAKQTNMLSDTRVLFVITLEMVADELLRESLASHGHPRRDGLSRGQLGLSGRQLQARQGGH